MTDIVPELMKKIQMDFDSKIEKNAKIKAFVKKLESETATGEDVSKYAAELGSIASDVLAGNLTEDILPNGRMYYNIADRTIKPLLQQIFDMVMDAAKTQQAYEDKKAGIGMKAAVPEFPEDRIHDLLIKFADIFDEETYNV